MNHAEPAGPAEAPSPALSGASFGGADAEAAPVSFDIAEAARYDDGGELGRGGMGVVHASLDRRLGRMVARKRGLGPQAGARLAYEAAIAASLDHPGIVTVHDAGIDGDGAAFYTMRLAPGRSLADALADAPSTAERLALVRRLLAAIEAVAAAHAHGVLHRDLKPANILLGAHGEVQVGDWGLALRLADSGAPARGGVAGTPAYLAPEVQAGQAATTRSDVFGLGVTLREIAGDGRLVGDASALQSAELGAIVARATAEDPAARYGDAAALAADLAAWLDGRPVAAYRYAPREQLRRLARAWRAPLWVAAVAVVIVALVTALALVRTGRARDRAVAARAAAQRALAQADRHLATALVHAGHLAAARGDVAEAAVLGAHAAAEHPPDDAPLGGIGAAAAGLWAEGAAMALARLDGGPALPASCAVAGADAAAAVWLCLAPDGATLGGGAGPRWRVAGAWDQGLVLRSRILLARAPDVIEVHRRDDGALLGAMGGGSSALGWTAGVDGDRALRHDAAGVQLIDAARMRDWRARTCQGRGTVTAALAPTWSVAGGVAAAVCDDGTVEVLDAALRPLGRVTLPPTSGRAVAHVAAFRADGAGLLLGAFDGSLRTIALPAWQVGGVVTSDVGQVERLVPGPALWAVAGERGGVELRSAETLALRARLPRAAGTVAGWRAADTVWMAGSRALTRWRLDPSSPLLRWPAAPPAHGLGALALRPDGGAIAVGRADGEVIVIDAVTGAIQAQARVSAGVVKGLAWSADGASIAVTAAGGPGLARWWPGRPPAALTTTPLRRAVRMASGAWLLATYGVGLRLLSPNGASELPVVISFADQAAAAATLDLVPCPGGAVALGLDARGRLLRLQDGAAAARGGLPIAGAESVACGDGGREAWIGGRELLQRRAGGGLGAVVAQRLLPGQRVQDVALAPGGAVAAVGLTSGGVLLVRAASLRPLALWRGHGQRVAELAFAGDGSLWSVGWDGVLRRSVGAARAPTLASLAALWRLELDAVLVAAP